MGWIDLNTSDTTEISKAVTVFKDTAPEHFWMTLLGEQSKLNAVYLERRLATPVTKPVYHLAIHFNDVHTDREEIAISFYKTLKTPGGKSTITNAVNATWGYWAVSVGFYKNLAVKGYVYPLVKQRVKDFYDQMDEEPGMGRKERLVIVEDASRRIPTPPLPIDDLMSEMKSDGDIKRTILYSSVAAHGAFADHMRRNLGQGSPKLKVTRIRWKTDS